MSDLATLKSSIAAFLDKSTTDFSINGVDLLLQAVNNAKRWAQSNYDFEYARIQATLVVNTTTGGLLSAVVDTGSNPVVVKKIESAYFPVGTSTVPIQFYAKKNMIAELRRRYDQPAYGLEAGSTPYVQGYSEITLSGFNTGIMVPALVQHGGTLFLYPDVSDLVSSSTVTVSLDVIKWMPDYSIDIQTPANSVLTDFFMTYGYEFLLWKGVIEANYLFTQFVNRSEGSLTPPDRLLDAAWKAFLAWDSGLIASNTTAFDLD